MRNQKLRRNVFHSYDPNSIIATYETRTKSISHDSHQSRRFQASLKHNGPPLLEGHERPSLIFSVQLFTRANISWAALSATPFDLEGFFWPFQSPAFFTALFTAGPALGTTCVSNQNIVVMSVCTYPPPRNVPRWVGFKKKWDVNERRARVRRLLRWSTNPRTDGQRRSPTSSSAPATVSLEFIHHEEFDTYKCRVLYERRVQRKLGRSVLGVDVRIDSVKLDYYGGSMLMRSADELFWWRVRLIFFVSRIFFRFRIKIIIIWLH